MKHTRSKIALIFFLLLCAAAASWVVSTRRSYKKSIPFPAAGIDMALRKIKHAAMKQGIKEWDLEAESAVYLEDKKEALLKLPRVILYLKDGPPVRMSAESGLLKTASNDIEAEGNVLVVQEDYRFKTASISYDHSKRLLFSNVPVTLSGKDFVIRAKSIKVDLSRRTAILDGDVKGIFHAEANL